MKLSLSVVIGLILFHIPDVLLLAYFYAIFR
jgi:hypothetical protein